MTSDNFQKIFSTFDYYNQKYKYENILYYSFRKFYQEYYFQRGQQNWRHFSLQFAWNWANVNNLNSSPKSGIKNAGMNEWLWSCNKIKNVIQWILEAWPRFDLLSCVQEKDPIDGTSFYEKCSRVGFSTSELQCIIEKVLDVNLSRQEEEDHEQDHETPTSSPSAYVDSPHYHKHWWSPTSTTGDTTRSFPSYSDMTAAGIDMEGIEDIEYDEELFLTNSNISDIIPGVVNEDIGTSTATSNINNKSMSSTTSTRSTSEEIKSKSKQSTACQHTFESLIFDSV